MAVYNPISLGDIYQQANAIKGQQQRSQLADLQIQEAQKQRADQEGIDSALTQNPNATLPDLIKAGGGMAGVDASTKVGAARSADLLQQNRQIYVAASQVASADDPKAAAQQVAPNFIADFEKTHGPGSFAQLSPDQVKQLATGLQQHALLGLVDPDKQFTAQQQMLQDHYKQEGPGGELQRNQNTIAAENARAAAERALQLRGQNITMRGQDLEAGRANKPQLVTVKNPDGTETQKWVMPGQTDGAALGPPSQKPMGEADKKNAVLFDSMLNAEKQIQALTAQKGGATDTSSKWNAFLGNLPWKAGDLAKVAQTDEYRKYESAGLRWAANLLYLKSGATANPDEIRSTWKQFFPQPGDGPDVKAQKEQARAQEIESTRKYMVPQSPGLPTAQAISSGTTAVRQDLASLQAQPGSAGTNSAQWDKRADGTDKGNGWLGVLRRPDGGVSSEISVGVNIGGKETEIPLMVPSLTKSEVITLLNSDPKDPKFFANLPESIKQKAVAFARQRIAQGQSPFASPHESPGDSARGNSPPPEIQSLLDKYR